MQDVVRWCCRTGYVSVNSRDNAGYTPLHGSCIGGHVTISRCLIEYGADVNAASRLDGARSILSSVLQPRVGSGVVRIAPLCFLAGCRTRELNQALSVPSLSLVFLSISVVLLTRPLFALCYFVICVFCLLVVLVRLSVPVQVIDWKDSSPKWPIVCW